MRTSEDDDQGRHVPPPVSKRGDVEAEAQRELDEDANESVRPTGGGVRSTEVASATSSALTSALDGSAGKLADGEATVAASESDSSMEAGSSLAPAARSTTTTNQQ